MYNYFANEKKKKKQIIILYRKRSIIRGEDVRYRAEQEDREWTIHGATRLPPRGPPSRPPSPSYPQRQIGSPR